MASMNEIHAIVLNTVRVVVGVPFRLHTSFDGRRFNYDFRFNNKGRVFYINFFIPNDPDRLTSDDVRAIVEDAYFRNIV